MLLIISTHQGLNSFSGRYKDESDKISALNLLLYPLPSTEIDLNSSRTGVAS
jgi:hypothetical protein